MTARQILRIKGAAVHTVAPSASLTDAAGQLRRHNVGALVVLRGETVVGVISERDLVRAVADDGAGALLHPVAAEMTPDVVTCAPETTVRDLMAVMTARRIRHVPVLDDGRLVGLVSIGDVVKHRVREIEAEAAVLQDALTVRRAASVAH